MKYTLTLIIAALVVLGECQSTANDQHDAEQICRLPRKKGICRAYIRRYYYDIKSGLCKEFVYGGCHGNDNSFETIAECMQTCGRIY